MSEDHFTRELALLLASAIAGAALLVLVSGWAGIAACGTAAWAFLARRRRAPRRTVVASLLGWAALFSFATILLTVAFPERAAATIPNGPAYWVEMRAWLATGQGKEASPALFVPEHLLHLAGFVVIAALTAGWGGLILGTYLLAYMSYYVGMVALSSAHPVGAALLAWHPWSVARVAGFVVLGVALSRLVLDRLPPWRLVRDERRSLLAGSLLVAADLVLKSLLAPHWPALLQCVR